MVAGRGEVDGAASDLVLPAPAKLNLFLHVVGRRADGYHCLQTAFQFVDWCDRLSFTLRADGHIHRVDPLPGVPPAADLTVRAARLLQKTTVCRLGVDIHLHKRLPVGGGLGGGSSDAATTLVALNRLWKLDLAQEELLELALGLGADVPVFVYGQAAWAEGVGERLRPLEDLPTPWYVIVDPGCRVSTAEVFQAPELTRDCPVLKISGFISGEGGNVCEPVVRCRHPEVGRALDWLRAQVAPGERIPTWAQRGPVRLSGTGACVFAPFVSWEAAQAVCRRVPAPWRGVVARGLNRSPLWDAAEGDAAC